MNELRNEKSALQTVLLEKNTLCEQNEEFTLPDYMPPIGRVVSVEGIAAPPSRYLGAGSAELAGAVRYRLLYESLPEGGASGEPLRASADGDAALPELWCAELVSEYDAQFPLERAGEGGAAGDLSALTVLSAAEVENVSARVTAPRRVSVRGRVRVRLCLLAPRTEECLTRGSADPESVRTLGGSARVGTAVSGTSEPVELHDAVPDGELPAGTGEVRIIASRGRIFLSDVSLSGGAAACRGEIAVELLLCREGGRPGTVTRRLPLAAEVPFDAALPEEGDPAGVCAWGKCTAVSAAVEEGTVTCEVNAVLCAAAAATGFFGYVRDVYSTERLCETAVHELKLPRPVCCANANFTVSGTSGSLGASGASFRLPDADASVVPESVVCEAESDGRLAVSGRIRATVVLDDGASFSAREFEFPFRCTGIRSEYRGEGELSADANVSVAGCRARWEGDGVTCDCELSVALMAAEVVRASAVSEVNFTAPRTRSGEGTELTVCYPAADDTLWSVARRYGADVRTVAEENGLDPETPEVPLCAAGQKFVLLT